MIKAFQPWYVRAAEVECFSDADRRYHRPLGAGSHVFRRQVEGFADTILDGAPRAGADVQDGLAAVRALAAIDRSVHTGDAVRLSDVAGGVSWSSGSSPGPSAARA